MSVWGQHGGLLGGKGLTINGAMAGGQWGVTFFAGNDVWAASLGMVNFNGIGLTTSPVLRGNYFLEAGDWEVGLGLINVSGSTGANQDTKRTGIDVQALGEVGDMQIGVFADWATAAAGSATVANVFNTSTKDARTGYSFRVSVKPMAQWIFLAGIGSDTQGVANAATVTTDKVLVGVEYELYQNFAVQLSYNSDDNGTTKNEKTVIDLELLI
jgi:hypothetical protein